MLATSSIAQEVPLIASLPDGAIVPDSEVDAEGVIYVQDTPVPLEKLAARLIAITGSNPEIRIFVRGDKSIDYGTVMTVMGRVNAAGFKKVSLLAKLPDQSRKTK